VISARISCLDGEEWLDGWDAEEKGGAPRAIRWTLEFALPRQLEEEVGNTTRKFEFVIEIFTGSFEKHFTE
jgi:hypothetical protein